jgi:hypothetical protein
MARIKYKEYNAYGLDRGDPSEVGISRIDASSHLTEYELE